MQHLSFSLVICTVGRQAEVARCLQTIARQQYPNLDVVFVDQTGDDRMVPLVDQLRAVCPVTHLRSPRICASAARNLGARHAKGEVITFPDDDCWYPDGLLHWVNGLLVGHPEYDGVSGRTMGENGGAGNGRFDAAADFVGRHNVWTTSIEFTIFLHRRVWDALEGFDERIGVGANTPFLSGEGTEFMIRAIDRGFRIWFTPELVIHHLPPPRTGIRSRRAFQAGAGMGWVTGRHHLPAWQTAKLLTRPFLRAGASLMIGRPDEARIIACVGAGRAVGYLHGRGEAARASAARRPDLGGPAAGAVGG